MRGACDCHSHVCGPASRYSYTPNRLYTPEDALPVDYRRMLDSLGMERGVLVQPSIYATDNACTLDAVRQLGSRARAVAVIDDKVSAAALDAMHDAGVRGVRRVPAARSPARRFPGRRGVRPPGLRAGEQIAGRAGLPGATAPDA